MSDTVDNVMDVVNESEPADVVVNEEATDQVEEAPAEEVPVEEEPAPVVEEVAEPAEEVPVEEESEPVNEEEPSPSETSAPVSTQEVVQNVQEILSSTETNVSVDNSESNDLENRVKVLEERLEKLVKELIFRNKYPGQIYIKGRDPFN